MFLSKNLFGLFLALICSFVSHLQAYYEPCDCFEDHKFDAPPGDEIKLPAMWRISLRWHRATSFVNTKMNRIDKDLDEVPSDLYAKFSGMYQKYLPKFQKLREDTQKFLSTCGKYHHFSHFDQVTEYLEALNDLHYEWDVKMRKFVHEKKIHARFTNHFMPKNYQKDLDEYRARRDKLRANLVELHLIAASTFGKLYKTCIDDYHENLRAYYEYGFYKLRHGDYRSSMELTRELIRLSKKKNNHEFLKASTFIDLGIVSALSFEYAQAVEALTTAIEVHGAKEDAYIERAIAYFELGEFDKAIQDFLASGESSHFEFPDAGSSLEFSTGMLKGTPKGLLIALEEAPASIFYTVQGTSLALWAAVKDPKGVPKRLIEAILPIIEYLRKTDALTFAQDMVPEVRDLLQNWEKLSWNARGEKSGFILGKYGVTIFTPYVSANVVKAVNAFKELRRANAICSLEAATASAANKAEILATAAKFAETRLNFFKKAKIAPDKQGKHIVGHKNYEELIKQDRTPSIFNHPEPERLLRERAGKGIPEGEFNLGSGYKEIVDFKECIGEYYHQDTKKFYPTSRGKIHYDKQAGAHIVPAPPEHF